MKRVFSGWRRIDSLQASCASCSSISVRIAETSSIIRGPIPESGFAGVVALAAAIAGSVAAAAGGRHGLMSRGFGCAYGGAEGSGAGALAVRSAGVEAAGGCSSESIAPAATAVTSMPSAVARLATIIASEPSSHRTWSSTDRDVNPKNVRNFIACLLP